MLLGRKVHFEVLAMSDDRWTVYSSSPYKDAAIEQARVLLAAGSVDAVKVTREGGMKEDEDVVFQEEKSGTGKKPMAIMPVKEAPECEDLSDFYSFESRRTIGRLLRKYLDENGLLAIELMHSYGHMRSLLRNDEMLTKAVHNIASVQAQASGCKHHELVDRLYGVVEEIADRARDSRDDDKHLALLKEKGLESLIEGITREAGDGEAHFMIRSALAKYLGGAADWEQKLLLLVEQAETEPEDLAMTYLDEIIAEVFDGGQALREVLGYQRNLGEALGTLSALSVGQYEKKRRPVPVIERLSAIRSRRAMPLSRSVMLDRIETELGGIKPLTGDGKEADQKAFKKLVGQLVNHYALVGKDNMISEAATSRAKSLFVKEGSYESWEKAIDDMVDLLQTKGAKFTYLIDLSDTGVGESKQAYIIEKLELIVQSLRSVTDLVHKKTERRGVIRGVAHVRDRLLATSLPEIWRQKFARVIYNLLMDYEGGQAKAAGPKEAPAKTGGKAKPAEAGRKAEPASKRSKAMTKRILASKKIEAGEYIFREGDEGIEAYMIQSGQVEISRKSGRRDVPIAKVGKGSFIGEMALIDSKPRMASARALKDTALTVIPKSALQASLGNLEKSDPFMHRLVVMFVDRMRNHPVIDL